MIAKEWPFVELKNFKLELDEQGVAVLTANRHEKHNARNDLTERELNECCT